LLRLPVICWCWLQLEKRSILVNPSDIVQETMLRINVVSINSRPIRKGFLAWLAVRPRLALRRQHLLAAKRTFAKSR
jgi:hypothetical protein